MLSGYKTVIIKSADFSMNLMFLKQSAHYINKRVATAAERGTPGLMDFRGPIRGPEGFRGLMSLKRPMREPNGLHRAH